MQGLFGMQQPRLTSTQLHALFASCVCCCNCFLGFKPPLTVCCVVHDLCSGAGGLNKPPMRTFNTPERGVRRGPTGHKLQTTARRVPVHPVCKIDEVLRNSMCRSVLDLGSNIYAY